MPYTTPPPRAYRNTYERENTPTRIIGLIVIYIILPILALLAYHYTTAYADRAHLFYQQTADMFPQITSESSQN